MSFDPMSFAGSLVTGLLNNNASQERQDSANTFSAQQYASRYQTTVADMQAAGLNPGLAYGGISGSSPSSAMASSAGTPDLGANMNQSTAVTSQSNLNSAQIANIKADTENKDAQRDLMEAQAAAARGSASHSVASVNQVNAMVDKIREEIKNVPLEGQRLKYVMHNLAEHSALMAQQGESEVSRRSNLAAATAKLHSEGLITRADYDAIVKTNHIGRIAREVKPISDIGADWLSPSKWWTNKSSSTSSSTITKGK